MNIESPVRLWLVWVYHRDRYKHKYANRTIGLINKFWNLLGQNPSNPLHYFPLQWSLLIVLSRPTVASIIRWPTNTHWNTYNSETPELVRSTSIIQPGCLHADIVWPLYSIPYLQISYYRVVLFVNYTYTHLQSIRAECVHVSTFVYAETKCVFVATSQWV